MTGRSAILYHVHDPMCSWCWGFRPALTRLREALPGKIGFMHLLGGLAPDSDAPMPPEMRNHLQMTWRNIEARIPGTTFNFDFWTECEPRRSTWPACRAVIAARSQRPDIEDAMISAIQHAYYLQARNPSDADTLAALAATLGLDAGRFVSDLQAQPTQTILDDEMRRGRAMGPSGFPSLRLASGGRIWPVTIDYARHETMLQQLTALTDVDHPPGSDHETSG